MSHPWIILFDIDGTLLTVKRTFNRPLIRRTLDNLGINYPNMEKEGFSGRTDHDILSSFLVNHDFDESLYQQLKKEYLERTETEMTSEHVIRHGYVDEVLNFFSRINCHIGLLTGNYPSAAKAKLKVADIHFDFEFGAFGEFDKDRNRLPLIALEEVNRRFGYEVDPSRFLIIGDTPRDVECAKFAGMKCIAVTTGRFTEEDLSPLNPDLIIQNLSDPKSWFSKISKT